MVALDRIKAARGRTRAASPTARRCERSDTFSEWAGCDVFLKFENQQKTGAFKIRGAYNKIQSLTDAQRAAGVIAPSAGNHAQAVAWAARSAGVPAVVYMPHSASLAKIGATEGYGARVELVGDSVDDAVGRRRAEAGPRTARRSSIPSTTRR